MLFFFFFKVRAREMAQLVKGLLCKREDLSSILEPTKKKKASYSSVWL